jgi:hypothetical protein
VTKCAAGACAAAFGYGGITQEARYVKARATA